MSTRPFGLRYCLCAPPVAARTRLYETPPCTPGRGHQRLILVRRSPPLGAAGGLPPWSAEPVSIQEWLSGSEAHGGHLVVRATYLPDTARCTAEGDRYRAQNWRTYTDEDIILSMAAVKCYADVRVNEYLVGSGPNFLTVQVVRKWYRHSQHGQVAETMRASIEAALLTGSNTGYWDVPEGGIGGREYILFLGPALDLSTEAWEIKIDWDVQRQDDGTIVAMHPHRNMWAKSSQYQVYKTLVEMPLATFNTTVKAAQITRMAEHGGRIGAAESLPMLVTDANQLSTYYRAVGALDDHPRWLRPAQPPPDPLLVCNDAVPDAGQKTRPAGATARRWPGHRMSLRGTREAGLERRHPHWPVGGVRIGGRPSGAGAGSGGEGAGRTCFRRTWAT